MAVAFRQYVTPWSTTSGTAGSSFTGTAGDVVFGIALDYAAHAITGVASGYSTNVIPPSYNVSMNDPVAQYAFLNPSISAGSQAITITGTGGDTVGGLFVEYSGAANTVFQGQLQFGPGTGAGAVKGISMPVPTGALIVAFCINQGATAVPTPAAGGSTTRNSGTLNGLGFCIAEWSGSGGYFQPTFTASDSSDYATIQFIVYPNNVLSVADYNGNCYFGTVPSYADQQAFVKAVVSGDVLVTLVWGKSPSTPFPFAVTDTINSGNYLPMGTPYWDSGTNLFAGAYYKVSVAGAAPTVTATPNIAITSCVDFSMTLNNVRGWQGTPTVDPSVSNYLVNNSGTSTTQTAAVSTYYNNEILFVLPASTTYFSSTFPSLLPWLSGIPLIYQTSPGMYCLQYNNPGATNFSATLNAASNWLSMTQGLYDSGGAAAPILMGQSCLISKYPTRRERDFQSERRARESKFLTEFRQRAA
jgi:hypothetical protein